MNTPLEIHLVSAEEMQKLVKEHRIKEQIQNCIPNIAMVPSSSLTGLGSSETVTIYVDPVSNQEVATVTSTADWPDPDFKQIRVSNQTYRRNDYF